MRSEQPITTIRQAIELGVEHHQAGRLSEAEQIYRRVLKAEPSNPDALYLLGVVAHQGGIHESAVQLIEEAIRLSPSNPHFHNDLGEAYRALRRPEEALTSYDKALAIKPDYADALDNRGLALQELKRYPEALASYDKALAIEPDFAEALNNRGNALQELKRYHEALASYDKALAIKPDFAKAANNRGVALEELGRYEEALASYDWTLAIKPDYAEALDNRGNALQELNRYQEALASYDKALAIKPDFPNALLNRGNTFRYMGRIRDAEASFRQVLAIKPDEAAHNNLGSVLQNSGRLPEAIQSYRRAMALKPDFSEAHSNLIFAMDLSAAYSMEEQQEERRRWYEQHGRKLSPEIRAHQNVPDPDRRLRVGYVSADFRTHSAYYACSPVILSHDRTAFEIYCYSGVKREDGATARLKQAVQNWRSTLGASDDALAEQIRADRIDILVDLSGHTAGNRLLVFARKPAPVQITAWGHVTGTGLKTMDYLLADPVVLQKQHRHLFAEEVIDLPCALCYQAPEYAPPVQPLPANSGRPFTFGCINRVEKISDSCIELWSKILAAAPGAELVIKHTSLQDAMVQEILRYRFSTFGMEPERVRMLGASPHAEHLKIYHEIDVGLDTFPNNGGMSTAEALWMGVPIVAMPGEGPGSRSSAAILTAVGLESWVAHDAAEYVRIAGKAAADTASLAALRQRIRPMMVASAFADPGRYTAAVERAYRTAWRKWCQGLG